MRSGRGVGAGLGLGQGERDELLAGRQRAGTSGPAAPAVPASGIGSDAELLDGEDQPGRGARPAELLDREADRQQLAAEAAVLGRERQGQDVVVAPAARRRSSRELAGPVDLGGPRRDALVGEDADGVAEQLVLLGQAVRGPGRGPRWSPSASYSADRGASTRHSSPLAAGRSGLCRTLQGTSWGAPRGSRPDGRRASCMDQTTILLGLIVAAALGIVAPWASCAGNAGTRRPRAARTRTASPPRG